MSVLRYQLAINGTLALAGLATVNPCSIFQILMFFMTWFNLNGATLDSRRHFALQCFFASIYCGIQYVHAYNAASSATAPDAATIAESIFHVTLGWLNAFLWFIAMK